MKENSLYALEEQQHEVPRITYSFDLERRDF